ncbi:MAG: glutathione S-transferase family protein [Brevundimonas sp.]
MGMLVDGVWTDAWYDTSKTGGRFVRSESVFRGAIGPATGHPPESGRYHLYVSLACPWAHRTLVMRALKGLDHISVSVVHWRMLDHGWTFEPGPGVVADPVGGADFLHQVYTAANPTYTGRVTVPVLWDRERATIVSNESADILRIFNSAFDEAGARPGDYYPPALRDEIDAINERVYGSVNNGVYKAGFATTQAAYEEAVVPLFETLDWLEARLEDRPWLTGDQLTEADIRLWTTLVRFDAVYHGHFKCNLKRLVDYPALRDFTCRLHAIDGVAETVNMDHIKRHYYESHRTINPTGVTPLGPATPF